MTKLEEEIAAAIEKMDRETNYPLSARHQALAAASIAQEWIENALQSGYQFGAHGNPETPILTFKLKWLRDNGLIPEDPKTINIGEIKEGDTVFVNMETGSSGIIASDGTVNGEYKNLR